MRLQHSWIQLKTSLTSIYNLFNEVRSLFNGASNLINEAQSLFNEYQNLFNEPQNLINEPQNLFNEAQNLINEAQSLYNESQTLVSEYRNLLTLSLNSPQPFRFLVLNRHTFNDACLTKPIPYRYQSVADRRTLHESYPSPNPKGLLATLCHF